MKGALPLTLAIALHLPVQAADAVPPYLTGVWGMAESSQAGTSAQAFVHLAADGSGFAVGSSPVMGFPIRATLDGDTLTLLPYWPGKIDETQAARQVLNCSYDAFAPALNCTALNGRAIRLQRRADQLDAEMAQQIETVRSQLLLGPAGR